MFRRMFGGDAKGGQAVSQSSANKTVDAIQKLGEVLNATVAQACVSGQFGHRVQVVVVETISHPVDTSTVRHCRQKSFW